MRWKDDAGLGKALLDAVGRSVAGERRIAVLFSGGLDSSVLAAAASRFCRVRLYTAGLEGSPDVAAARKAAEALGLDSVIVILDEKKVADIARKVAACTKKNDRLTISVGVPIYACMEVAQERRVLSGLGAEEAFVGYDRFQRAVPDYARVRRLVKESFDTIAERDLARDLPIAAKFGKELGAPFLDIAPLAMALPPQRHVSARERKIILKQIGRELGLPGFVVERPKKAAQYGSGADRVLSRGV